MIEVSFISTDILRLSESASFTVTLMLFDAKSSKSVKSLIVAMVGALFAAVVKLQLVVSAIPGYEFPALSSSAVASI